MAHAQTCPICCGKGKLPNDGKTTDATEPICYGCDGKGWVEVADEMPVGNWPWPNPNIPKEQTKYTYTGIL